MIVFSKNHLSVISEQAYKTRDELMRLYLLTPPKKSRFLSIYARSLGYADWGTLQHLAKSYSTNTNTVTISPDNIMKMASTLRSELGDGSVDVDTYEAILASVATKEEKILLGVDENYRLEAPESITIEFGPEDRYSSDLIFWLFPYLKFNQNVEKVSEIYCSHVKDKRAGLTRAQAKEVCLDVFPKSGKRVPEIIESLVQGGYFEWDDDDKTHFSFTQRGVDYVSDAMTGGYCDEWQDWWKEFSSLLAKEPYKQINDDWSPYIYSFSRDLSPQEALAHHAWDDVYKKANNSVCEAILEQRGVSLPTYPEDRFHHVLPRIYLNPHLHNLPIHDVEFSVTGPDWCLPSTTPNPKRLWPNPRYIGLSVDGHNGWYNQIPSDVTEFEITLHWSSRTGAFMPVSHTIFYRLESCHQEPRNWLYATSFSGEGLTHPEFSFHSMYALTHGEQMTRDQLMELDRVKAGLTRIEIANGEVKLMEDRTLVAANGYRCLDALIDN